MDINEILSFAMAGEAMLERFNNNWKDEILKKWEQSKSYPRKKKKITRKQLNLDWQIASHDIFNCL